MQITPGRVVAFLTPLVFAPLAGSIAVLAAKYFPGVDVDSDKLTAIFITGAGIAFGKGALWLKGWQDWEKKQDPAAVANDNLLEETSAPRSSITSPPPEDLDGGGFDESDAMFDESSELDDLTLADGSDDELDEPDLGRDDLIDEEDDALGDDERLLPLGSG